VLDGAAVRAVMYVCVSYALKLWQVTNCPRVSFPPLVFDRCVLWGLNPCGTPPDACRGLGQVGAINAGRRNRIAQGSMDRSPKVIPSVSTVLAAPVSILWCET